MTKRIPKRIIQTDKSAELPLLAKAATTNMRLLNPDFEYMFFDDNQVEKFVDAKFPQYRAVFDSFPERIQRYDLFRYLAVYHFGGFYFDTDIFLASSLADLCDFGCVFPFEHLTRLKFFRTQYGMDWEIGNYAFGASAGHPFLGAILTNCLRAQEDPEWAQASIKSVPRMFRDDYYPLSTTGPGLVSRTLAEYPRACDEVKVLFPEDVRDPASWFCFGTYGIHLQSGSWRKRKGLVRRVSQRHWESMIGKALLKESLKRGAKRSLQLNRETDASRQKSVIPAGFAGRVRRRAGGQSPG